MNTRREFLGSTIATFAASGLAFKAVAATSPTPFSDKINQIERWCRLFRATEAQQMATQLHIFVPEIGLIKGPKVSKITRPAETTIVFEADPLLVTRTIYTEKLIVVDWRGELLGEGKFRYKATLNGPKENQAAWEASPPFPFKRPKEFVGDTLHLTYTLNLNTP